MKISYAVTVCREFEEIQKLIPFLIENKREEDEIVVSYDVKNGDINVEEYLRNASSEGEFTWHKYSFDGNFADMKNSLTEECSGDYIFQIDADEMPTAYTIDFIHEVVKHNDVDIFKVPRINTVEGITPEHIKKWNWGINDQGWINFPDYQWRIYRNDGNVKWKNRVHEVLTGYKTMAYLPAAEEWCLLHAKTINRQEQQNEMYNKL